MSDENEGTTDESGEAQTEQAGTPQTPDEVTTLRSRNAGLDAKVTELSKKAKAAETAAAEAAAKLAAYEAQTVGADEALRAQLQAKDAELAEARREAAVARIEAKYPETYGLFGDAVATMADDVLAASEARLKGVAADTEPPKPIGNNPSRSTGGASGTANPAEETVADIEARLRSMTPPWEQ
jgi:uncharacterized protein (DUF3084 family)